MTSSSNYSTERSRRTWQRLLAVVMVYLKSVYIFIGEAEAILVEVKTLTAFASGEP